MPSMSESEVEKIIEEQLEENGWSQIDRKDHTKTGYRKYVTVPEVELNNKEADYVLYINGLPVAIIEAKNSSKIPRNHLQQARNYAQKLTPEESYSGAYSVPFVFASNGNTIVIDDLRVGSQKSREVRTFLSPDDMSRQLNRKIKTGKEWLDKHDYEDTDKQLWENQQQALSAVKDSILSGRQKILVSMATGSGKTRLAMALVQQLLESGFANRVLFVPDTKRLKNDGLEDFRAYDPIGGKKFSDKYGVGNFDEYKKHDANVVVDTIQKVRHELREHPEGRSVGEFDVIIADECHRGVNNEEDGLGMVLDYYDGIEIGLTATPHEETIKHYNNNHVYSYDYHEALNDDRVVPFEPHLIQTKITMDGFTTDEGTHYSPKQFGRDILIHDTHRMVARNIIEKVDIENELTLVFAQNIEHANVIAEDFQKVLKEQCGVEDATEMVKTVTNEDRHANEILDEFDKKRRNPKIVVTVDMVSTGVDIRPLNNLIFLRAVKSEVLFNQMMGRGTRNTPEKTHFKAFDCLGVLDHHAGSPFRTDNIKIQYQPDDDTQTKDEIEDVEPLEIEEDGVDQIVKSGRAYPLEGGFVDAGEYMQAVTNTIVSQQSEIATVVDSVDTLEAADGQIEGILQEEWRFFTRRYVLQASGTDSLFHLVSKVLEGHDTLREKANRAKQHTIEQFGILPENEKWIDGFEERATLDRKTIGKRTLLSKPFSNYGGYDEAKRTFDDLEKVLVEFNSTFLSIDTKSN